MEYRTPPFQAGFFPIPQFVRFHHRQRATAGTPAKIARAPYRPTKGAPEVGTPSLAERALHEDVTDRDRRGTDQLNLKLRRCICIGIALQELAHSKSRT